MILSEISLGFVLVVRHFCDRETERQTALDFLTDDVWVHQSTELNIPQCDIKRLLNVTTAHVSLTVHCPGRTEAALYYCCAVVVVFLLSTVRIYSDQFR